MIVDLHLIPCPFCGGNQASIVSIEDLPNKEEIVGYTIEIRCPVCLCSKLSTHMTSLANAILGAEKDWNTRIIPKSTTPSNVSLRILDKTKAR